MKTRPQVHFWLGQDVTEPQQFYVNAIPGSKAGKVCRWSPGAAKLHSIKPLESGEYPILTAEVILPNDFSLILMNGGMPITPNEASTIILSCDTQEYLDTVWNNLVDGGKASVCGWLSDKYGFHWQIVPTHIDELLFGSGAANVQLAMFKMGKLDIATLEAAAATPDDLDKIEPMNPHPPPAASDGNHGGDDSNKKQKTSSE